MSLLGKILAFLNVLGVAGFITMAVLDFYKQQDWKLAVFKHDLFITGLPVDDKETTRYGDNEKIAEQLAESTQTLKDIFKGSLPEKPVTTQVEEVKRVSQEVQGRISQAGDDKNKQLVALAHFLMPLARTNGEREELISVQAHLGGPEAAKMLQEHLAKAVPVALELVRKDLNNPMIADPKKRHNFEEAYVESVFAIRNQLKDQTADENLRKLFLDPKTPFERTLLQILPRDGKKYDEAFTEALAAEKETKKPLDELFLQILRKEQGKSFKELFDQAYNETIDVLRGDLQARLDNQFKEAGEGNQMYRDANSKSMAAAQLSPAEQKRAIALLLFNLVEPLRTEGELKPGESLVNDPGYKRVLTVVGLVEFNRALDRQAAVLDQIARELGVELTRDRTSFVQTHEKLLNHIRDRADQVETQNQLLLKKKEAVAEKQKIVERRKLDIDIAEKELAAAQKVTGERMQELLKMSKELYEIRREMRDATQKNQALEYNIRYLEQKKARQ
jgi:hypothetical protein